MISNYVTQSHSSQEQKLLPEAVSQGLCIYLFSAPFCLFCRTKEIFMYNHIVTFYSTVKNTDRLHKSSPVFSYYMYKCAELGYNMQCSGQFLKRSGIEDTVDHTAARKRMSNVLRGARIITQVSKTPQEKSQTLQKTNVQSLSFSDINQTTRRNN